MKKYETLEIQTGHRTAVVWLNRPEVRNAFNDIVVAELTDVLGALEEDPEVRAVVLAGRGKAFCAGADLNWMRRMADYSFEENYGDAHRLAAMLHKLYALNKPTIARVHGAAYAGGLGLIAACDIAVASQEAEFCVSEVKLGLAAATIGPYLVRAIGERQARRYLLSAEVFTAAEAYRIGLVQELATTEELDATVNWILGFLVQGGPAAQVAGKDLIRAVAGAPLTPDLIADTATRIASLRASDEAKEGISAFLEKRPPSWALQSKPAAKRSKKR